MLIEKIIWRAAELLLLAAVTLTTVGLATDSWRPLRVFGIALLVMVALSAALNFVVPIAGRLREHRQSAQTAGE